MVVVAKATSLPIPGDQMKHARLWCVCTYFSVGVEAGLGQAGRMGRERRGRREVTVKSMLEGRLLGTWEMRFSWGHFCTGLS